MLKTFLALLVLLVASASSAADGAFQAAFGRGDYFVVEYLLCDDAPATCAELNLDTKTYGSNNTRLGMPSYVVIEIQKDNCTTTPTQVTPRGLSQSAGLANTYSTNMATNAVSSVTIDPVRHRYYDATVVAGSGGSCNDFEVVLRAFYSLPAR